MRVSDAIINASERIKAQNRMQAMRRAKATATTTQEMRAAVLEVADRFIRGATKNRLRECVDQVATEFKIPKMRLMNYLAAAGAKAIDYDHNRRITIDVSAAEPKSS